MTELYDQLSFFLISNAQSSGMRRFPVFVSIRYSCCYLLLCSKSFINLSLANLGENIIRQNSDISAAVCKGLCTVQIR